MEHIIIDRLKRDPKIERLKRDIKRLDWQNEFLSECLKYVAVFTVVHVWIRMLLWVFN